MLRWEDEHRCRLRDPRGSGPPRRRPHHHRPEQKVPTCPDWTAADLLWHLTEVHEFWGAVLAHGVTREEEAEKLEESAAPRPERFEELLARRVAATEALLEQFDAHEDEEPAWFWYSAEQTVSVIRRMQTHEATIHRVDAELAAGRRVTPIAPQVAHAGLDHVLRVMWPAAVEWIPEWAEIAPVAVAEITAEAGQPRRLLISRWSGTRPRDGREFDAPVGRLVTDEDETDGLPRADVSGAPLALDLWAWGRGQALDHLSGRSEKVEIVGDQAAVAQMEALIAEGHD
ncbi:maleylpyruvate isomerase N-terminal domain-containing protein [Brachybacterium sp. P6-10-X1]|uniref:maleylpyruvate isomerase N-terminal domain-containing protein n=1 Tax=Brachybacterium sp. P6-10-X1 TaxID=1903186 RepID=UPI0020A367F2|nr:maleylpyruvate isomerase family mycothiol-dependent enzyme [Brachybacterium sp. P6-10-X1]